MPYLDAFTNPFTANEARHLLKRTSFGITESLVQEAVTLGLKGTIEKLFTILPEPEPPLKYLFDGEGSGRINDPDANYGETWITNHNPAVTGNELIRVIIARKRSLYAWTFQQYQNSGISIREKLTLFWHNHFVCKSEQPHREYEYMKILRANALGNFKELTKQITIDPNMLQYLSGSENTNIAPNENYARELLELFTIGKGVAVGNGDYTNYTEEDIVQIAKVLTGWRVRSILNDDALTPFFSNTLHSKEGKTLSHRFNNAIIQENGAEEYKDVIDVIFQQNECSRFIMRQLYSWFISEEITDDIETNIIEPLAIIIRNNNYDISQALQTLFTSEHFFEKTFCMIKSPVDLMLSATQALEVTIPFSSINLEYQFTLLLHEACTDLEQSVFSHPDVAGWKAYYQQPLYYKTWINSYLLPKRLEYCKILITGGNLTIDSITYSVPALIPVLDIVARIDEAENPNTLINSLAERLFNYSIDESQVTSLKEVLIPGLPDFEWTVEYDNYLQNPTDFGLRTSVQKKLQDVLSIMVQMSEFQIM